MTEIEKITTIAAEFGRRKANGPILEQGRDGVGETPQKVSSN